MSDLKTKRDYFAKNRRSNYVASMRLEGVSVKKGDACRKLATRKAVLKAHSCKVAG